MIDAPILGVTPFYSGYEDSDDESRSVRLGWLEATLLGMQSICPKILVSTSSQLDLDMVNALISRLKLSDQCSVVKFDDLEKGVFLPVVTQQYVQQSGLAKEFVLFTESDQIFHIKGLGGLLRTIGKYPNMYISPHRCIKLSGDEVFGEWKYFGHYIHIDEAKHAMNLPPEVSIPIPNNSNFLYRSIYERFWFGDDEFVVCNKPHALLTLPGVKFCAVAMFNTGEETYDDILHRHLNSTLDPIDDMHTLLYNPSKGTMGPYGGFMKSTVDASGTLYLNTDKDYGYGAGFLCHTELFDCINFTTTGDFPLENASGFCIFHDPNAACMKTVNTQTFWVDHLSHRYNLQKFHRNYKK